MPRWPDRWIVVENWAKFQSRRERPDAPWIKLYRALLHKPEWLDLTPEDQALLVNIWLAYAESDGRLRVRECQQLTNTRRTPDAHRMFVTRSLERLNGAGFIGFCDDKPLPLSLNTSTRARENKKAICPFCEMGGGYHTTDCPTLDSLDIPLMAAVQA